MYYRDSGHTISLVIAAILGVVLYLGLPIFLMLYRRAADSKASPVSGRPAEEAADDRQGKSDDSTTDLSEREANRQRVAAVMAAAPTAVAIFGATFCLLFALLNPLLQLKAFVSDEFLLQLHDGTLVLRLSTIAFAGTVVWKVAKYMRGKEYKREFADDLQSMPEVLSDDLRRMRDVAQSALFVAALFTLWLLYARGVRTTATAFLAYVFAFFNDDWWIISDYSRELKGRLLRSHKWRLSIANGLLLAPLAVIAWQEFRWWEIVILYLVAFLLLMYRYIFFSEAAYRQSSRN